MGLFEDNNKDFFYTDVVLPFPLRKAFTYKVPHEFTDKIEIGKRAIVQFGKRKIYTALIVKIHKQKPEKYKAKEVLDILDEQPIIYSKQLKLWQWIADYYCSSVGEVMAVALPPSLKLESESKVIINPEYDGDITNLTQNEIIITESIVNQNELSLSQIQDILKIKNIFHIIKSLYQHGIILPKEELKDTYKVKKEKFVELNPEYKDENKLKNLFTELEKAPKQLDVILSYQSMFKKAKKISQKELIKISGASSQIIKSLEKKKILIIKSVKVDRIEKEKYKKESFELKDFQQKALEEIKIQFEKKNVVLLHGITSSGKTHLYINLIEDLISKGQQVLYLVPEISLTAQLIRRLRNYFGNKIGIYHSKFNPNERYEIWHKTLNQEYSIVLGVRSAMFLPFKKLGLIIIDEEHESTFKQQNPAPRYQARDTAVVMTSIFDCKCLLGTATPSFETYFNTKTKKYGYVKIDRRFTDVQPPEIILSDLKDEYKRKKMKGHFGSKLYEEANKIIKKNDQVIFFQNRRGYAPYIECQTCGWVPKCKNCDISLTYHMISRTLSCHYCGYKTAIPTKCDNCGNTQMKMKGFGTEKIEDDLEVLFPGIEGIRMDYDTTRKKKAYHKLISKFEKGEAQILVGTQMVTKGFDFEKVKLVGILNADQMLNYPDFRAVERSYQLISQVSGRAGRRKERGKVIVQTFTPEHPAFIFIQANDFEGFYNLYMKERRGFKYPPLTKLILISLKDKSQTKVSEGGEFLAKRLKLKLGKRVLGPEAPPISKLRNLYINQIMLKFERDNALIKNAKETLIDEISKFNFDTRYKSIRVVIDVDPY
ncbi:MAG: primosomal protein N' [Bacteroidota bacterium]|nr:primosomal protein N' [Bacteroidota bacterium]